MPTPLAALAFALGLLPGVTLAAPSPMPEIRGSDVSSLPGASPPIRWKFSATTA
jgi:hypothetical protein